ncbi:MAG: hypothetical protein V2I33_26015 [Kangiellaceae bacterium]|jgi:hypothetical protein|nr:hypothetical protein [Kangiellaceae bacterium]
MLKFVLKGNDIVTVEVTSSVQLTTRVDMPLDEFFAADGETDFIDRLAAVLGIPSYQIRIFDVYEGSTVIKMAILPNA